MGEGSERTRSCTKHGRGRSEARSPIEAVIDGLPPNQGGSGRHACAYCAYEYGYRQAEKDIVERLRRVLDRGRFG